MSYLNWHVGMKVVCVDPRCDQDPPNPIYGDVYTISFIYIAYDDAVMIDLVEMPNPESDQYIRGYEAKAFRPVRHRKTDVSIFTAMLTTKKHTVDA